MNTRFARASLILLGLLAAAAQASTAANQESGDWCSSVVVRPDRRMQSPGVCTRVWNDSDLANAADVVLLGSFKDVDAAEDRSVKPQCGGPFTHQTNAAYIDSIRRRRLDRDHPILFVRMTRFDLVSPSEAQAEGFQSKFLLTTKTPISNVKDFFRSDRSAACRGRCRWSFRRSGAGWKTPWRLDRLVDAAGPGPSHEEVVYYVSLRDLTPRDHYPLAGVGNLTNAAYRQWKVDRAKRSLQQGSYDAVLLGEKFGQYYKDKGYWLGSSWCPDVASCTGKPDTVFSAQPDAYGFAEYVAGWVALAHDLQSANVPYVVRLIPNPWLTRADDPSTPEVNEASEIRSVFNGAQLVMIDAGNTGFRSIGSWIRDLRASGINAIPVDQRCGYTKRALH